MLYVTVADLELVDATLTNVAVLGMPSGPVTCTFAPASVDTSSDWLSAYVTVKPISACPRAGAGCVASTAPLGGVTSGPETPSSSANPKSSCAGGPALNAVPPATS